MSTKEKKSLQIIGECVTNRRIYGDGDIHDAVVMEKVCHMIVNVVRSGNVFLKEIRKEKYEE